MIFLINIIILISLLFGCNEIKENFPEGSLVDIVKSFEEKYYQTNELFFVEILSVNELADSDTFKHNNFKMNGIMYEIPKYQKFNFRVTFNGMVEDVEFPKYVSDEEYLAVEVIDNNNDIYYVIYKKGKNSKN